MDRLTWKEDREMETMLKRQRQMQRDRNKHEEKETYVEPQRQMRGNRDRYGQRWRQMQEEMLEHFDGHPKVACKAEALERTGRTFI